jgi:hypothetical protein
VGERYWPWFRDAVAKVESAATGGSAFRQVRVQDRLPTQSGLSEPFPNTFEAEA